MQKKKSGVKKCLEICVIKGGGRRLMEKSILNFHFDYLHPSLSNAGLQVTLVKKRDMMLETQGPNWPG